MARFTTYLLAITVAACQLGVNAAPLTARAKNNGNFIQCNVARLKTVTGLASTTSAVQKLSGLVANDATTAAAVTSAQSGLKSAQTGIQTIAKALISRQPPPAAARDQVGQGLNTAQTALDSINSTDATVTSRVNDAKAKLKQTLSAGQQVVDNCGTAAVNPNPTQALPTATDIGSAISTESLTATAITGIASSANGAATSVVVGTGTATATVALVTGTAIATNVNQATDCPAVGATVTQVVTVTVQPTATAAPTNNNVGKGKIATANDPTIGKRQIGNLRCNIARLQAVQGLSASTKAVGKISTAAGNDAATASAVGTAQAGLKSAQDGISTIAKALVAGQPAPAEGRTQVDDGLKAAQTALGTITSTDLAVTSAISTAQNQIADTLTASASVASNCK